MVKVGIDDLAVYVPKLYVDHVDFAIARNMDSHKLEHGIGIKKMAIPDVNQDANALAGTAALRLMEQNHLKPDDIGRIYVATESSVDETKAMNSFVIGMLEDVYGEDTFEHAGGIEGKFACVSGSYMLQDNVNWIRADEHRGKAAIVIVSDIAEYDLNSSGEQTQGAGAVAMLIKENPRLLAFDPKVAYTTIKDEYDFYRPFGVKHPLVNGQYSNLLYLRTVRKAFDGYKKNAVNTGLIELNPSESILDHIDYIDVHLPYRKMGENASAYLFRHEWRVLPRWKNILSDIGIPEPVPTNPAGTIESTLEDKKFMKDDKEFMKAFMNTEHFRNEFKNKVESSLQLSAIIGNLYTASMYMGLRSLLEFEYRKGVDLEGKRIGFGSYGSGSSALAFSGVIQPQYKEVVGRMNYMEDIEKGRKKITMEQYERLHERKESIHHYNDPKGRKFVLVAVGGREAHQAGHRKYKLV